MDEYPEMEIPGGGFRDLRVDLPQGMVVDPTAIPTCTEAQLESGSEELRAGGGCPDASAVGVISLQIAIAGLFSTSELPLYNMVPPAGSPAEFGFSFFDGR